MKVGLCLSSCLCVIIENELNDVKVSRGGCLNGKTHSDNCES